MKKKWIEIVLTVLCICIIVVSVYLSPDKIRAKSYAEIIQNEPPIFSGVINIWQISTWRVAQSSKTLCLLDAAKEFEKKHNFVFIEVQNISIDDYQKAISEGRYPDVLSFPAEMEVELTKCTQINDNQSLLPILKQTYYTSGMKVVPWLYTSSVLIANSKQIGAKSLDASMYQNSQQTAQIINELANVEANTIGSIYALIPLAVSDTAINTTPKEISPYNAWNSFVSKETSVIYGSIWQNYSMNRLIDRDKGFDCTYIIPSDDMPQFLWTQNLCIFSADYDKNIMINKYIDLVLSEKYQIKFADKTASFPATNIELDYGGIRSDILSAKYNYSIAIVPGIGIFNEDIISALKDESGAKDLLRQKVIIQ